MPTYLQSKTARLEEMRLKGQEIELWMAFHSLPLKLKKKIWRFQKYKWQETGGVDVEGFLHNLPSLSEEKQSNIFAPFHSGKLKYFKTWINHCLTQSVII